MDDSPNERLTDAELHALLDRLFPHGFAGVDVLKEIAPDGWERSPLLACFHPSVERVFEERLQLHPNIKALGSVGNRRDGTAQPDAAPLAEPTLEEVQREHQPQPVRPHEELTELVGLCLWDVFSDSHDVIAADGRLADIGSFRGAGAFLDEHLTDREDAMDRPPPATVRAYRQVYGRDPRGWPPA
jgi:hypothetical protein